MKKQQIIELLKILVGAMFSITALFGVDTGNVTPDLFDKIFMILGIILGGGFLGSATSNLKNMRYLHTPDFKRSKRP